SRGTGEIWPRVPETLRIVYSGKPGRWVVGKDMILKVISEIGDDGALYMAMEHSGDTIAHLSLESRLTLTNMAIEGGAKSGIVPPDDVTVDYVKHRQQVHGRERPFAPGVSDPDARVARTLEIDVAALEPMVAQPSLPSRAVPVSEVEGQEVDQVFIGSCTNARMEDLRTAAALLDGRKAHPRIRLIVIPATQDLYQQALHEGLIQVFADAGASVAAGVCGPCRGGCGPATSSSPTRTSGPAPPGSTPPSPSGPAGSAAWSRRPSPGSSSATRSTSAFPLWSAGRSSM